MCIDCADVSMRLCTKVTCQKGGNTDYNNNKDDDNIVRSNYAEYM